MRGAVIALSFPSSIFRWSNFKTSYYSRYLDVKKLSMEDPRVTESRAAAGQDSVDSNLEVWAR
ncbi:MAG TPA: hypothetical protein VFG75_07920, partial [Gaiella sp.]|nr:hypothetical protein [Gaiella sp.]